MKRSCFFIVCVLMVVGLTGCSGEGAVPSFYGDWSIDGVLDGAPMGDFEQENMSIITDVPLTFSEDEAICFGDQFESLGQTVFDPDYITNKVSRDNFESMTGMSFDSLGIRENHITQVAVVPNHLFNDGIVFYVVNDDMLLSNSLGTFFVLRRIS